MRGVAPAMSAKFVLLVLILTSSAAWTRPPSAMQAERPLLAAELSSRAAARAARVMDSAGDPRFPFPTAQELAAIKKVAETLIMLGQEVIPSIIGEASSDRAASASSAEIAHDVVNNK